MAGTRRDKASGEVIFRYRAGRMADGAPVTIERLPTTDNWRVLVDGCHVAFAPDQASALTAAASLTD